MRLMYAGTVCLFSTWGSRQSSNFLGEEFFFLGGEVSLSKPLKLVRFGKYQIFFYYDGLPDLCSPPICLTQPACNLLE